MGKHYMHEVAKTRKKLLKENNFGMNLRFLSSHTTTFLK